MWQFPPLIIIRALLTNASEPIRVRFRCKSDLVCLLDTWYLPSTVPFLGCPAPKLLLLLWRPRPRPADAGLSKESMQGVLSGRVRPCWEPPPPLPGDGDPWEP